MPSISALSILRRDLQVKLHNAQLSPPHRAHRAPDGALPAGNAAPGADHPVGAPRGLCGSWHRLRQARGRRMRPHPIRRHGRQLRSEPNLWARRDRGPAQDDFPPLRDAAHGLRALHGRDAPPVHRVHQGPQRRAGCRHRPRRGVHAPPPSPRQYPRHGRLAVRRAQPVDAGGGHRERAGPGRPRPRHDGEPRLRRSGVHPDHDGQDSQDSVNLLGQSFRIGGQPIVLRTEPGH